MYGVKGSSPQCKAPNCTLVSRAGGYCATHYVRLKRYGTLERIAGTPSHRAKKLKWGAQHLSEVTKIDKTPDTRKGQKGYLAPKICSQIKHDAIKHGYEWDLTPLQVYLFFIAPCSYCGEESGWPKSRNGIDRVDTSIGYFVSNCVTACRCCNFAKGVKTHEEFMAWGRRFAQHNGFFVGNTNDALTKQELNSKYVPAVK